MKDNTEGKTHNLVCADIHESNWFAVSLFQLKGEKPGKGINYPQCPAANLKYVTYLVLWLS